MYRVKKKKNGMGSKLPPPPLPLASSTRHNLQGQVGGRWMGENPLKRSISLEFFN
jgi:hypothetical protein